MFDEKFDSLLGWGTSADLKQWYADSHTKIVHACFVCGSDGELVFIDSGGYARIYSLTTQQFR